ncbi:MAG TPA: META domain-containing protein [Saccharospirillum sp.]|nr:META domain-containing protein [Saccharospirillum sp.]
MPTNPTTQRQTRRLSGLLAALWLSGSAIAGPNTGLEAPQAQTSVTPAATTLKVVPPQPESGIPNALTGRVFQWQYSLTEDGDRLQPADPQRYQLRFASADRISLKADCNQYAASLRMTDTVFTTGPMIGTRALCPRDSLEREFIAFIEAASEWQMNEDSELTLRLPHDGGIMRFEPIKNED